MVDKEKIKAIIQEHKDLLAIDPSFSNCSFMYRGFWNPLAEAVGSDEDEIIEFIKNADEETQRYMSSITEELYDKFPTDKMGAFIDSMCKIK